MVWLIYFGCTSPTNSHIWIQSPLFNFNEFRKYVNSDIPKIIFPPPAKMAITFQLQCILVTLFRILMWHYFSCYSPNFDEAYLVFLQNLSVTLCSLFPMKTCFVSVKEFLRNCKVHLFSKLHVLISLLILSVASSSCIPKDNDGIRECRQRGALVVLCVRIIKNGIQAHWR